MKCLNMTICALLFHLILVSLVICHKDDCADELLLRLKGSAFASQGSLAGRYTKGVTSGGKIYWTNGDWVLWEIHGQWRFGKPKKNPNILSIEYGRLSVRCPENASWKYWGPNNVSWRTGKTHTWIIAGKDSAKLLKHSGSKCSKEVMVRLLDMVAIKQESLAGKYTKAGTSGGKPYWVKGSWAIWASKEHWRIGPKNKIGTTWTNILSIGTSLCPEDIIRWRYWSRGWKNADEDSIVLPYLANTMVVVGGEGYGGRGGQVLGEPGCQLPQLPVDTIGNGLAIRGSKLITCGTTGCGRTEPCRDMCYSLDNSRKFWTPDSKFSTTDNQTSSIMDEDELGPKTVAMENGVYVIGSRGGQVLPLGEMGMYPWKSEVSAEIMDLIYDKKDGLVIFLRSCAVRIGPTEFLLIGGNKEGMEVEVEGKKILKFDTKTNKWTKMPGQLSQQRWGHACALYDDPEQPYVIIAGGVGDGQMSSTELYFLKNHTITTGGSLQNGRSGHNLVSVESGEGKPKKTYAIGGPTTDIEVWNDSTKSWDSTDLQLNKKRSGFGALAVPKFMVCG